MSSSYRPRRTRIYGANYDIGENYYKKQLQDLDHKRDPLARQRRELSCDDAFLRGTPKVSFASPTEEKDDIFKFGKPYEFRSAYIDNGDDADDIYSKFKRRDEGLFKQKSPTPTFEGRAKNFKNKIFDEDDAEFMATTRRSKIRSLLEDNDDEIISLPPRKSKFRNLIENNDDDIMSSLPPRKSKFRSMLDDVSNGLENDSTAASVSISKRISTFRQNVDSSEASAESKAASSRAARTMARLADLENEMENISIKQNERQKRSLNLRKLIRDSESADIN